MGLIFDTDIPYGNAHLWYITENKCLAEIAFSPEPHGGPEAMWFCFRIARGKNCRTKKLKLVLKHFKNLLGAEDPSSLSIVVKTPGSVWKRLGRGSLINCLDGQVSAVWDFDFSSDEALFALSFPYGEEELDSLVSPGGYWKKDDIGLSQEGRPISRVSNSYGAEKSETPGIYFVARQHSGEVSGSWVLHGLLTSLAARKEKKIIAWGVPLSNIDGIMKGDYGKDNFPYDLNRAWGSPAMRHETLVIKNDISRWFGRCAPKAILDFHSPSMCETDGTYAFISRKDGKPHKKSVEFGQIIKEAVSCTGFASEDFVRSSNFEGRWSTPPLVSFASNSFDIPSLSFEFPYSFCGSKELHTVDYIRIGEAICEGICKGT